MLDKMIAELETRNGSEEVVEWLRSLPRGTTAQQAWDLFDDHWEWMQWLIRKADNGRSFNVLSDAYCFDLYEATWGNRNRMIAAGERGVDRPNSELAAIVRKHYPKAPEL